MNIEDFTDVSSDPRSASYNPIGLSGVSSARASNNGATYNIPLANSKTLENTSSPEKTTLPESRNTLTTSTGSDPSSKRARITFYWNGEPGDPSNTKEGYLTSKPGPKGQNYAEEGVTAAVDPSIIPYGSNIHIPGLKDALGHDVFNAHDTGSAVKAEKASGGKLPVIDLYLNAAGQQAQSRVKEISQRLAAIDPNWEKNGLPYSILQQKLTDQYSNGQKAFRQ